MVMVTIMQTSTRLLDVCHACDHCDSICNKVHELLAGWLVQWHLAGTIRAAARELQPFHHHFAVHEMSSRNAAEAAAMCMQDAENSWAFDIFGFADATPGYSLSLIFCHLVKRSGLCEELMVDGAKLGKYARRIERGYNAANPYHNSVHVASVVQMTHMLMCYGGVMKTQALSLRQQMATYFSALVHDFEHGGVNNDFLVHTLHCIICYVTLCLKSCLFTLLRRDGVQIYCAYIL